MRLSCCLGGKHFRFPASFTKRTGRALIHNQLVDRSPLTNVCHETSCYESKLSHGFIARRFQLQLRV